MRKQQAASDKALAKSAVGIPDNSTVALVARELELVEGRDAILLLVWAQW